MKSQEIECKNAAEWRKWLKANHAKERVVWLIFKKGKSKEFDFSYRDALEEALCYGWIDSIIKKVDDESYLRKFTPRTNTQNWSDTNIALVRKLIANGKMSRIGMQKISEEILHQKPSKTSAPKFDSDIEKLIKSNKKAWENFNTLAPSYQKQYIGWIQSAKKQDTKVKRANEAIGLLENGKKLEGK